MLGRRPPEVLMGTGKPTAPAPLCPGDCLWKRPSTQLRAGHPGEAEPLLYTGSRQRYGETHVCLGRASAHPTSSVHQPRDPLLPAGRQPLWPSVPGAALGFTWKPSGQDRAEQGAAGAQPVALARWRWGVPRALGSEQVRAWPRACVDDPPSGSRAGEVSEATLVPQELENSIF